MIAERLFTLPDGPNSTTTTFNNPRVKPKEADMGIERKIDALVEAGWNVLESDFDEEAFLHWRLRANECLEALLGADHIYTERFKETMGRPETNAVLAGVGVLAAVSLSGLHNKFIHQLDEDPKPGIVRLVRAGENVDIPEPKPLETRRLASVGS
jgi:hypothetical protein